MKKVLVVLILVCSLSSVASADVVLYGPGDWFVYYVAGRAISWAYDHWNDPYATRDISPGHNDTDGCVGHGQCPVGGFSGGGGGGW